MLKMKHDSDAITECDCLVEEAAYFYPSAGPLELKRSRPVDTSQASDNFTSMTEDLHAACLSLCADTEAQLESVTTAAEALRVSISMSDSILRHLV